MNDNLRFIPICPHRVTVFARPGYTMCHECGAEFRNLARYQEAPAEEVHGPISRAMEDYCPHCDAMPGFRCRHPSGSPASGVHLARRSGLA